MKSGLLVVYEQENQDPRKLTVLFELLLNNPLNGEGGSFGDSSRMYLLQGVLAQQEWRVNELLHRLHGYLMEHLRYPYKNVRDRIGRSVMRNSFWKPANLNLPAVRVLGSLGCVPLSDEVNAVVCHLAALW